MFSLFGVVGDVFYRLPPLIHPERTIHPLLLRLKYMSP